MIPAFWLTVRIKKRRIPIPFPIILPLMFVIEVLAFLPLTIYSLWKKNSLLLRIAMGFYVSRFIFAFILHGRKFRVNIVDNQDRVKVAGAWT